MTLSEEALSLEEASVEMAACIPLSMTHCLEGKEDQVDLIHKHHRAQGMIQRDRVTDHNGVDPADRRIRLEVLGAEISFRYIHTI
jgi:hypothetical protein